MIAMRDGLLARIGMHGMEALMGIAPLLRSVDVRTQTFVLDSDAKAEVRRMGRQTSDALLALARCLEIGLVRRLRDNVYEVNNSMFVALRDGEELDDEFVRSRFAQADERMTDL